MTNKKAAKIKQTKGTGALKNGISSENKEAAKKPIVEKKAAAEYPELFCLQYHPASNQYHYCTPAEANESTAEGWFIVSNKVKPEDIEAEILDHKKSIK